MSSFAINTTLREIRDAVNARDGNSNFTHFVDQKRYVEIVNELNELSRDPNFVENKARPAKGVIIAGVNVRGCE